MMQWRNTRRSKEFYSVKFPLKKHFLAFYFFLIFRISWPWPMGVQCGNIRRSGKCHAVFLLVESFSAVLLLVESFPLFSYLWVLSRCILIGGSYLLSSYWRVLSRCLLIGRSYPAVFLLERHIPLSSYWWVLSRSVFLLEGPIPLWIFIGGSYPAVFLLEGPIPLSSWTCVCSVVLLLVGYVP